MHNFSKIICQNKTYLYNPNDKQTILGEGAFGIVYLGHEENNVKMQVAIKIITIDEVEQYEVQMNEIKIMKEINEKLSINDKKLFVEFLGFIHDSKKNKLMIIMEYCNMKSLDSFLKLNKELDERKAIKLIFQLINGLQILQKLEIVHRDLKPANIMLHQDNESNELQIKIADFGCSKQFDKVTKNQMSMEKYMSTFAGTPHYMSAEILQNKPYTSKSDVWALGMIYYQMLFGELPWKVKSIPEYQKIIENKQKIVFPLQKNSISKPSQNFIKKCLEFEEVNRVGWEEIDKLEIFQKKAELFNIKKIQDNNINPVKIEVPLPSSNIKNDNMNLETKKMENKSLNKKISKPDNSEQVSSNVLNNNKDNLRKNESYVSNSMPPEERDSKVQKSVPDQNFECTESSKAESPKIGKLPLKSSEEKKYENFMVPEAEAKKVSSNLIEILSRNVRLISISISISILVTFIINMIFIYLCNSLSLSSSISLGFISYI